MTAHLTIRSVNLIPAGGPYINLSVLAFYGSDENPALLYS